MNTNTPTPWKTINSHKAGFQDIVSFGNDERQSRKWICEVQSTDTEDADYIVKACNAFPALVEALHNLSVAVGEIPVETQLPANVAAALQGTLKAALATLKKL